MRHLIKLLFRKDDDMRTNDMGKSCVVCKHSYTNDENNMFCELTDEPCITYIENDIFTTCEEFKHINERCI